MKPPGSRLSFYRCPWWLVAMLAACKSTDAGVATRGAPTAATTPSSSTRPVAAAPSSAAPSSTAPAAAASSTATTPALLARPAAPRRAYRVAALGDSLTDPQSHGGGYLSYIKQRCPETRIDNFARGGYMLNQIRRRFENTVHQQAKGSYTHVIVWGGVNDLYSDLTAGRTPQKAQADLSTMYEKARNKGAQVVALTVSPWGGFKRYHSERRQAATLELNAWIRQQLETAKVDHVIDTYSLLSCGAEAMLCPEYQQRSNDGLHLGQAGHQLVGKALFEAAFSDCR